MILSLFHWSINSKNAVYKFPEEVSIVGFDNSRASQLITPKLTTVAQDFAEMGALATKRLIHQIEEASIQGDARCGANLFKSERNYLSIK